MRRPCERGPIRPSRRSSSVPRILFPSYMLMLNFFLKLLLFIRPVFVVLVLKSYFFCFNLIIKAVNLARNLRVTVLRNTLYARFSFLYKKKSILALNTSRIKADPSAGCTPLSCTTEMATGRAIEASVAFVRFLGFVAYESAGCSTSTSTAD